MGDVKRPATRRSTPRRLLAVFLGAAVSLVAAGCTDDDPLGGTDDPVDVEEVADDDVAGIDTEAADVFRDADALVGEQLVGVVGEVSEIIGPDGFLLEGLEGGEVFVVASATPPLEAGAIVEVSGEVMTLDPETFEDDFGLAFDEAYQHFAGEAVLRAPNVEVAEPGE
jgi:hypothetical protein